MLNLISLTNHKVIQALWQFFLRRVLTFSFYFVLVIILLEKDNLCILLNLISSNATLYFEFLTVQFLNRNGIEEWEFFGWKSIIFTIGHSVYIISLVWRSCCKNIDFMILYMLFFYFLNAYDSNRFQTIDRNCPYCSYIKAKRVKYYQFFYLRPLSWRTECTLFSKESKRKLIVTKNVPYDVTQK